MNYFCIPHGVINIRRGQLFWNCQTKDKVRNLKVSANSQEINWKIQQPATSHFLHKKHLSQSSKCQTLGIPLGWK